MENVLLVGEDYLLLDGWANLLAEGGAFVACCSANEFDMHQWKETYGLVVLCHTLKP